jgi:hypothetical protein
MFTAEWSRKLRAQIHHIVFISDELTGAPDVQYIITENAARNTLA